jgi:hypothetical protein
MPWPYELGLHILDFQTNTPKFWPWPKKDWLYNRPALDAVSMVFYMKSLMKKSDELWTKEDNKFYTSLHAKPEVNNGRSNITL